MVSTCASRLKGRMMSYRTVWMINAHAYFSIAEKVGLIIQGVLVSHVIYNGCGFIFVYD